VVHLPRHAARAASSRATSDPAANTGLWVDIVSHVANVLAAFRRAAECGRSDHHRLCGAPIAIEPDENELAFCA